MHTHVTDIILAIFSFAIYIPPPPNRKKKWKKKSFLQFFIQDAHYWQIDYLLQSCYILINNMDYGDCIDMHSICNNNNNNNNTSLTPRRQNGIVEIKLSTQITWWQLMEIENTRFPQQLLIVCIDRSVGNDHFNLTHKPAKWGCSVCCYGEYLCSVNVLGILFSLRYVHLNCVVVIAVIVTHLLQHCLQ